MTDALERQACLQKKTGAGAVPGASTRDAGPYVTLQMARGAQTGEDS
jgi:hypothetical protein